MYISSLFIISFFCILTHAQKAHFVCTPDVCNKHGTCIPNVYNSFTCQCHPGFYGPTCNKELDECVSSPCANNGTCLDLENGFLCRCLPEWNGSFCTETKNPCQSSPCGAFGTCVATSQPQIPYYCQCPDGQNTIFKCADTNPCRPNPCGPGECEITTNLLHGYICRCHDGTVQMTNCSVQSVADPCETSPCGSQGRCIPLSAAPKGYMCICQSDSITFTTIDTCPNTNAICNHLTCKNGGTCMPYSADEPSCAMRSVGSTCCQCPPNYTGSRCEQEINFCSSNPCSVNGRCLSGKFGYQCQCFEEHTGDHCEVRLTRSGCASNPCTIGICYQLNKNGPSYVCICPDGTLNLSCSSNNTVRHPFALPTIPPHSVAPLMAVNSPRYNSHEHRNMITPISTCSPSSRGGCNGGQCISVGGGVYTCRCPEGYTGVYCETNINECASNPCLGGGTCYDLINAFACFCPDRIFRPQCNATSVSPTVRGTAVLMATSRPKVSQNNAERFLVQNECRCRNGGVCVTSLTGEKVCQCYHGFTGLFCESMISEARNPSQAACNQGLCQNGGTCQDHGISAACACKPGFTGQRCESEYFRCQANGRFADPTNCKQGRYFECVYFGQYDLGLPNGVLYIRNCPPGLWFNALNDRCDYPSAVRC